MTGKPPFRCDAGAGGSDGSMRTAEFREADGVSRPCKPAAPIDRCRS